MIDLTDHIKTLTEKAAKAEDSGDAMRWSQAAANAAHAMETARNCLDTK